jgi:hypothetical protein
MKPLRLHYPLFLLLLMLVVASSCKKERNKSVTIERDCTGTYLSMDGKDYHVCNTAATDAYNEGSTVKANFVLIGDCQQQNDGYCMLYHENEGWVEVEEIQ